MAKLVYKRKNGTWEARYKKGKKADGRTHYASVIGHSYEEAVAKRLAVLGYDPDNPVATSEMNILILGAGSFGREVKEVLEQIRIFNKIAFLDDFITGEGILGKCTDASMFRINYACAFVAIGDSAIRRKYAEMLKEKHFLIPTIISPGAIVSPKAIIGMGSMVFAQGNVGAATVGEFCIVEPNGLINANVLVGSFSHLDSGAIVLKDTEVPEDTWVRPGKVFGEE
jgi:acetyltransferase-like isoleucine patch superfamily enzyme